MENPIYDLIIGNIEGALDTADHQESSQLTQATAEDPEPTDDSVNQMTDATKKGNPSEIIWTDARERAFQELKKRISEPPISKLPDVSQPFILQTNASHIGIGAVLLQEDSAGEKCPVAYASRKLQPRESRYSTIERECLAIVWGITKFQEYLYGSEFILETDHQPLQYLRQAKISQGSVVTYIVAGGRYTFQLQISCGLYRPKIMKIGWE